MRKRYKLSSEINDYSYYHCIANATRKHHQEQHGPELHRRHFRCLRAGWWSITRPDDHRAVFPTPVSLCLPKRV